MIYAGIGSRNTPQEFLEKIEKIGKILAKKGHVLRSGAAGGADLFFENGCDLVKGDKEIYLPWKGFNGSKSKLFPPHPDAFEIAKRFHPRWDSLSQGAKSLMARNSHQVLGEDLHTTCDFIVCYTCDGKDSGGTGQAIRIGREYKIPVFNIYHQSQIDLLKDFVK